MSGTARNSRATFPMTPDPRPNARAWLIVGLLWFVAFFNYLARITITTMHGSIVHSIPMTETQFGLLTSSFLWIYGLLSPAAGFLSDRFSRSRVIVCSLFAWSALTWLTAYATNFQELLIMRALMGASEACYLPAGLALITDYHRGPTRSLATGVHMTGIMFGQALGGFGGWLAETRSWNFAFVVMGVSGVAYAVVLFFALRDAPREGIASEAKAAAPSAQFLPALASLFKNSAFVLVLCFWGLLGIVGWAVVGWMPVFVQEHFHMGQGEAGFSATLYVNIAALIGVLVGGAWADRWAKKNELGRIYVVVVGLCVAAPAILLTACSNVFFFTILGARALRRRPRLLGLEHDADPLPGVRPAVPRDGLRGPQRLRVHRRRSRHLRRRGPPGRPRRPQPRFPVLGGLDRRLRGPALPRQAPPLVRGARGPLIGSFSP